MVPYCVTGMSWHSMEELQAVRVRAPELTPVRSMEERIRRVRARASHLVTFGKSGIHGWGLMARQTIRAGEMVFDYRGVAVLGTMADVRERRYHEQGKDCYVRGGGWC